MIEPYYSDEFATIYHGDCVEVMESLGNIADLIFTSPPYNLGATPWPTLGNWKPGDSVDGKSKWRNGSDGGGGIDYADHEDTMPWPDYVAWQHEVWSAMWSAITSKGAIFYNHKPRVIGARLWKPDELIPYAVRQEIIWARAGGMNYNPTAFVSTHERIYIVAREAWRLRSKAASGIGDVWRVNQEPSDHPAPFPLGLPQRAIEATDARQVLDPFCGSGTTLLAAKNAGAYSIGIDKSERYCEMAAARLGSWEHSVTGPGSLFAEVGAPVTSDNTNRDSDDR